MKIYLILSIFFLFGCSASHKTIDKKKYTFETLIQGTHGGYETKQFLIIRDFKSLQKIYNQVNMFRRPGFPIPEINFEKEQIIALFMGKKNKRGYSISVQHIYDENNKITVLIKETKPEEMAIMAISQPFYFCTMTRVDEEVVFKIIE